MGRFIDGGMCGICALDIFLGLKSESFGDTGECGEDGVWERLSHWRRHSIWRGFGIGDIECFMEVDDLRCV